MKCLDIGAGYKKFRKDAISIDHNPLCNPDVIHDLNIYPWPFKDNEFDIIYSSHCLEHLDNLEKAIEEIWRIGKPNCLVIIKVPHFSSRIAYVDIEHKHFFSIHSFRNYTPEFAKLRGSKFVFKIEKIKLYYQPRIDKEVIPLWAQKILPLINFFNKLITLVANINIEFCERVWCYWVGGMGEVEFILRVVK